MSNEMFHEESKANKLLTILREFTEGEILSLGKELKKSEWSSQKLKIRCASDIQALCEQAIRIFISEQKIKINSSCLVLGDIYGNMWNLMLYENLLWKAGQTAWQLHMYFSVIMLIEEIKALKWQYICWHTKFWHLKNTFC